MNHAKGSATSLVLVALAFTVLTSHQLSAQITEKTFALERNPAFESCVGDSASVTVSVTRGTLSDTATITGNNFLPHLKFDLFTVQRSNLLPTGKVNPNFTNFGLAWYQTDLHADENGHFSATIHTVLFDQIFGFDPDIKMAPTHTFHIGMWFDNPEDAVACGFDASKPTPFNGEHKAGPVALISVPDATSKLGPLCTSPNGSGGCNP